MTDQQDSDKEGSLLRQTLMSQDECFVYKVPPLATSSGYRANDWNLASPLQTCGFQVERRDNDLYLLFTLENHTKLFALTKIDDGQHIQRSVEPVLDSSRYFVTKITTPKPILLGFGFRDRDVAIDLLGNLQQFQKSIERELQAKHMKVVQVKTLAEGEKMHIKIPGAAAASSKKSPTRKKKPTEGSGGGPLLLKKPPPGADANTAADNTLEVDHIPEIENVHHGKNEDGDTEDSGAAVVNSILNDFDDVQISDEQLQQAPSQEVDHVPEIQDVHHTEAEDGDTENSSAAVAKSIIHDYDDGTLDGELLGGSENPDTVEAEQADSDDFGDFQGA